MNLKILGLSVAACLALGIVPKASAGWFVDTNVPVNSNNPHEYNSRNTQQTDISVGDGRYTDSSGSNSNNRFDNRVDRSSRNLDSFNTDNRDYSDRSSDNRQDRSVNDSFNVFDSGDHSDRRVDNSIAQSYDYSSHEVRGNIVTGGDVRNSVLGDFNQLYSGTDLRSGISGSGNTIDAQSVNITTFGDTVGVQK